MKQIKFTLLELIVVVAIIGLLMTILVPSLSQARVKARQAICMSNQSQIATATLAYAVENRKYCPYNQTDNNWADKLISGSYIPKSSKGSKGPTFKCPDGAKSDQFGKVSIAMNNQLTGGTNNSGKKTESILRATASETLLIIDAYKWWVQTESSQMSVAKLINDSEDYRIARHNFFASVTFLDGHVKSKSASFLLSKNDATDTFWDPKQ